MFLANESNDAANSQEDGVKDAVTGSEDDRDMEPVNNNEAGIEIAQEGNGLCSVDK